jgi:hypothetical protein
MTCYEKNLYQNRKQMKNVKSQNEKIIEQAKNTFPDCKGLYPDCPDRPDKNNPMCRTCPVLD